MGLMVVWVQSSSWCSAMRMASNWLYSDGSARMGDGSRTAASPIPAVSVSSCWRA